MINKTIWFIINCILLFDSINGFLFYEGLNIPLSQSIKILLILLISIKLFNYRYGISVLLVLCYSLFLFSYWASFYPNLIGESLSTLFKFLSVILIFCYIKKSITLYPERTFKKIHKAISINAVILSFNIILGTLGIGYTQYNGAIGSRGFFYSGNEISGVILTIFPYLLFYVKQKFIGSAFKYFSISLLLLTITILTTTKTAILSCLLSICLVPLLNSIPQSHKKKKHGCFILFSILIISYGLYYALTNSPIWERWSFFYEKNGLIGVLLSGRDDLVNVKMEQYLNSGWLHLSLGLGRKGTVEVDPFDTLFNYGIIGCFLVYGFYIYLLITAITYKARKIFPYASLVVFIDILILFASSIAGHIIFSGMSGVFIALTNGLIFYKKQ